MPMLRLALPAAGDLHDCSLGNGCQPSVLDGSCSQLRGGAGAQVTEAVVLLWEALALGLLVFGAASTATLRGSELPVSSVGLVRAGAVKRRVNLPPLVTFPPV
jgi:hypothetical protein